MIGLGGGADLSTRSVASERMDAPDVEPAALAAALGQVERVNAVLGGLRSLRRHLRPLARELVHLRILDVGVGNGSAPARLSRELRLEGVEVRWVGIDLHPEVIEVARRESGGDRAGLVRADAAHLPFAADSFDVSMATLTLHHMPDASCRQVLGEMARVTRRAVLVSDLERGWLHYLGARVFAATVWRHDPVTRHDAPLSVRRSFTRAELLSLAESSALRFATVHRYFPFRLLLEGRP